MFFLSSIKGKALGVLDTSDMVEEFILLKDLDKVRSKGIDVYGNSLSSYISLPYNIVFNDILKKYEGKTPTDAFPDNNSLRDLTYVERFKLAIDELLLLVKNSKSISNMIRFVIQNADYEYEDCFKKYEGMLILVVSKYDLYTLHWYLRED